MRIYAYKAIKVKVAAIINDRCRFKRHYKTLWQLSGRIWQHNLCAQKNCPSQDSDFIAKFDRHKDAQFLDKSRLVTQALEIKAKAVYRRIFENPCVGGSIPPRATKKHRVRTGHMLYVRYRPHGLHLYQSHPQYFGTKWVF